MKRIASILLLLGLVACGNKENSADQTTSEETQEITEATQDTEQEPPILIGIKTRKDLETEPYASLWYTENYELHTIDSETITQFKSWLNEVTEVKLFMGTWCSDSQREVPAFFKIMDEAGLDYKKLQLITVTRDKDTPEKHEEGLDITNVPTFIFYKDGKELNRIVESPVESLEKDMLAILSGEEYKHTYAE